MGFFTSYTLAEGEITGHRHLITAKPKTEFEVLQDESGQVYLKMENSGQLTHEEHKTIEVMPDMYIVGNEEEFDYNERQLKRVVD